MSETEDTPESDSGSLEIGEFIEDNASLFTVLSIFGAISVYVNRFTDLVTQERTIQIGFVAALFLFLLSTYIIDKRFVKELGGLSETLAFLLKPTLRSYEAFIFVVAFHGLIFSFVITSYTFQSVTIFFLQIFGLLAGFIFPLRALQYVGDHRSGDSPKLGIDHWRVASTLGLVGGYSAILFVLSGFLFQRIASTTGFSSANWLVFSTEFSIAPVIFAIGRGMAVNALLYGLVVFVFVVIHIITVVMILFGVEPEYSTNATEANDQSDD